VFGDFSCFFDAQVYIFKFPFSGETLSPAISAYLPIVSFGLDENLTNCLNFYLETFQLLTKRNGDRPSEKVKISLN